MISPIFQKVCTGLVFAAALVMLDSADAQVRVSGYTRKDGTYVRPHYRSNPNGNFYDNWSTKGNVNPYTGKPGTRVTPPADRRSSSSRTLAASPAGVVRPGVLAGAEASIPPPHAEKIPLGIAAADHPPVVNDAPIFVEPEKHGSYSSSSSSPPLPTPQESRAARMAMWRERIEARRRHTWATLPTKEYTDEDLAECKLQAARLLIEHGRFEAGQKWLNRIVDLYPTTVSAAAAREMLEPAVLASAK